MEVDDDDNSQPDDDQYDQDSSEKTDWSRNIRNNLKDWN